MEWTRCALLVTCSVLVLIAGSADGFALPRRTRDAGGSNHNCDLGDICAFQVYDSDTLEMLSYLPRCHCRGSALCVPTYNNLATGIYNFRCTT